MSRRLFTSLLSVLYLVNIVIVISQETASIDNSNESEMQDYGNERKRPHIIIILADDMGWNDVSFHGSDQIPTPNIDALAYNGIILNNHYVQAFCTPSRSALLTGKYPIHLGMQSGVLNCAEPRGLPLNEKLLPQYLKQANYKTHIVGKWHLGYYKRAYTPTYRGFDTHFGYWNGLQDYYNHTVVDDFLTDTPVEGIDMRRNLSIAWDTVGKYSTDLFTKEAIRLINAHDTNDPMFLYLSHLAPHSGNENNLLQAPAEEISKFSYITDPKRRIYAAMVSKLDQSVGEVVEALNNRKMLENSIILFMSDNGAPTEGYLRNYGSNYPFRGIKGDLWEGGVRGVATIWSPLIRKRERVSNQLISIVDWLPTLLSAANINKEKIPKIDGLNIWPALLSDNLNLRQEVLINIDKYSAIRRDNFKYVKGEMTYFTWSPLYKEQPMQTWIGDSGRSANENRPPYDPEKVLHSKAGIAIAQTIKQISDRKRNNVVEENILTSHKILQLRNQAVVHCNVTEDEKGSIKINTRIWKNIET